MPKPSIVTFDQLAELLIQNYERYLPTAFDETHSLVQKVNMVIVHLNDIGKVTNELVDKWNEVILWIGDEGVNESVVNKLNEMVVDGTLATLINETVFDQLNTDISNNRLELIAKLETHAKSVKEAGAFGNYVDLNNRGNDDSTIFNQVFSQGGLILIPDGNYYLTQPIVVPSHTEIIFSPKANIYTSAMYAFRMNQGTENVKIRGGRVFGINQLGQVTYTFFMDGNRNSYNEAIKDVIIEGLYSQGFKWFGYLKCVRKSTFESVHGFNDNGIHYLDKSAEVVISNSNFVKNSETSVIGGSVGLKTEANAGNYPEGLVVENTLFYHFEKNLLIKDLYVGKFTDLYLDGGGVGCLDNEIHSVVRTQMLSFINPWVHKKGFIIGEAGYSSVKEFRTRFISPIFDGLVGVAIYCHAWVHEVEANHLTCYGDNAGGSVGLVTINQNNYIKVHGFKGKYMASNIQIKGNGQFVDLYAISNNDALAGDGIYIEHDVIYNGVVRTP